MYLNNLQMNYFLFLRQDFLTQKENNKHILGLPMNIAISETIFNKATYYMRNELRKDKVEMKKRDRSLFL